ncbi:MAG TPA: NAD-dependent epimerase/dehydratase family protein [Gemmatimonadales bacterium]|nr:NAD-dependent epimerase/dehydratase family protein [Gemmatimonadales bacterium]
MKVLVTGAGGFVGRWLLPALVADGHEVLGTRLPGEAPPGFLGPAERRHVHWLPLDLRDTDSTRAAVEEPPDAVIHLAAVASGADARRDPGFAWEVNAAGTARLVDALGAHRTAGTGDPLFLLVSSAEVYGAVTPPRLRVEDDPPAPLSPYAASKLGAEIAAMEAGRRTGLRVIIARAFPHTGPDQTDRYVVPALARRLNAARRLGAAAVKTGNLQPVRDFLDVRDVVVAYLALLSRGEPGQIYNVASGQGIALTAIFQRLAELIGVRAVPEVDPALTRIADLPHLVGDASRLRRLTGWTPRIPFDQTLQDIVHAQAD